MPSPMAPEPPEWMPSGPAPWMSPEPPPHPADTSSEYARALELLAAMNNAEAAFNNPDMVYPDISPSAVVPELVQGCQNTEAAFYEHLRAARAVLGTHPRLALEYELMDTPDDTHPTGDPEGWLYDDTEDDRT